MGFFSCLIVLLKTKSHRDILLTIFSLSVQSSKFHRSVTQARIQDFGKGGGTWGVGDKLAVRSSQVCAPGGLKACPLGTFEILDAFSCNLVFFPHLSLFLPIFCR